jgi:hypothetical protein
LKRRAEVVVDDGQIVSQSRRAASGAQDLAGHRRCAQRGSIPLLPVEDRGEPGQVGRDIGVAGPNLLPAYA